MAGSAKPPWGEGDDTPLGTTRPASRPAEVATTRPLPPGVPGMRPASSPAAPHPGITRPLSHPAAPGPGVKRPLSHPAAPGPGVTRPFSHPSAPIPGSTRPLSQPAASAPGAAAVPRRATNPGAPSSTEPVWAAPADDPETRLLVDGLDALHVALGHARLYGPHHRETVRAVGRSFAALSQLTQRVGPVPLHSSEDGLIWNRALVHAEDDAREGIGRMLHREGIASLMFGPGIGEAELTGLLSVLRINLGLPQYEEETLESLLWQAGMDHISFQAVAALAEAEALSGRAVREAPPGVYNRELLREVLEVRVGTDGARRNLREIVGEDVIRRAVDKSRLAELGPGGETASLSAEQGRWKVRFAAEGTEDAEEITRVRNVLEAEKPGEVVARTISLLLRVAAANRAELPPLQAIALARAGIEDAFDRGDTVALAVLAGQLPLALSDPELLAAPAWGFVHQFVGAALPAQRIARLLLTLGPDQADERSLAALVGQLPDETLVMVLDGVANQVRKGANGAAEQGRLSWLQETMASVSRPRLERWLDSADVQPPERLVLIVEILRGGQRTDASRSARRRLLQHGQRAVREAALRWYQDELPRDDAVSIFPHLLDRAPTVRQAAADVIIRHKPYEAGRWLREQITAPAFAQWEGGMRRDLLVLFGRVAPEPAAHVLQEILEREIPPGRERDIGPELEGAALGLAESGSVAARSVLKRLASSGHSAARRACEAALHRLEEGGR